MDAPQEYNIWSDVRHWVPIERSILEYNDSRLKRLQVAYVFTGARCLRSYSSFILHELGGWSQPAANMGSLVIGRFRGEINESIGG